jgi:glycosyltransferase involved in cell wall biosynthesis
MLVSIITPVENLEYLYGITLDSIIYQNCNNFEWVIVYDNCGSIDILKDIKYLFEAKKIKLKLICLNSNYGPSVARNVGFQVSDGDVITYLDAGDYIYQDRVDHILKIFNENDIDLLFDGYSIFEKGCFCGNVNHLLTMKNYNKNKNEYLHILKYVNISIPMGVSHTRKPFVQCGGFQRGIVCGEDGILWRRMLDFIEKNRIMFTDSIAGNYYVNQVGQSRTQRRFDNGGFAFDSKNPEGSNGQYLDKDWFETFSSVKLFDRKDV